MHDVHHPDALAAAFTLLQSIEAHTVIGWVARNSDLADLPWNVDGLTLDV